jgi:hypothetical protein
MNPISAFPVVFFAFFGLFYAAIFALIFVSYWKIYVKMGVPGWKGIVPFYNIRVMVERLRKPRSWFWILFACLMVILVLTGLFTGWMIVNAKNGTDPGAMLGTTGMPGEAVFAMIAMGYSILILAVSVVALIYEIRLYLALTKAFGYDAIFTLGLFLLPIVFFPILAFGGSRFQLPDLSKEPIGYSDAGES